MYKLLKDTEISYWGLHSWIKRNYGLDKKCEHCGRTDAKVYDWSNKSHTYKRDRSDWQRVCRSCHRKFDYKYNSFNNFKLLCQT